MVADFVITPRGMLFFLLLCATEYSTCIESSYVSTRSIDELHGHFSVDKQSIQNVGRLLDQMRRVSYGRQFDQQSFHDVSRIFQLFEVVCDKHYKGDNALDLTTKQKDSVSLYLFEGSIHSSLCVFHL